MSNTYPQRDQYINWKEVPASPKPKKVPCDAMGREINPHDPKNWMSYSQATSNGPLLGFDLTEGDPYFVLDFDGCRDPITGAYTQEIMEIAALFPGAGMEVSHSGTGIHIWGCCEAGLDKEFMNRDGDRYEFYQSGRFIALGSQMQGDCTIDWTDTLRKFLKPRSTPAVNGLPAEGPVPEYTGPADDDLLIRMACEARGSIAAMFGNKARFKDLWAGNAEVLAQFYPTDTDDAFDRSRADAALLGQLAFWTGKDVARMERLWLASPLTASRPDRKKLDRDAYRATTVRGAAEKCSAVYARPPLPGTEAAPTAGVPSSVPGATGAVSTGGYMTIHEQQEHFKDCVYVEEDHKILTSNGNLLDEKRFRVRYGGYEFQMTADGSKPTKCAWEAFTQNRTHRFPSVEYKRFTPTEPFGHIEGNTVNTFKPREHVDVEGDPSPFLDLVAKLLPDERDRNIVLAWFAAMVQSPGHKFQWALVLQGTEGNGKTFLLRCLAHAVGTHMSHFPNPEDMNEKYNSYLEGNLLIGVEEVHMNGRRDMLDRLKKYITNDRVEIRGMQADKRMGDNLTNWIMLTNHQDAIIKSKNDRRYAIFFTAQQYASDLKRDGMDGEYFPQLWEWARNGGFDIIATWLRRYTPTAEFDPRGACHRAPVTSSTHMAIEASLGPVEQEIREAVEEGRQGFRGGWISSIRLTELMERNHRRISHKALSDAVVSLGYEKCEAFADGRGPTMQEEGNKRPRLYCLPEINEAGCGIDTYRRAQGYTVPGAGLTVVKNPAE